MRAKNTIKPQSSAWLMHSISYGAVVLSIGLAGVGVSGLVGWASPLLAAGSVGLIAAVTCCELAAARLPVHAEARFRENPVKGSIAVAAFVALTGVNLLTGHAGLQAIDQAGVSQRRAPLEAALTMATAQAGAAAAAETAIREAAAAQSAEYAAMRAAGLDQISAGYFAANGRLAAQADAASRQQVEAVSQAAAKTATAMAALAAAKTALAATPGGREDRELFAIAAVLELLKGCLIWLATSGQRRSRALPPEVIQLKPLAEMDLDELDDMASRGASLAAKARHEKNRRRAAA